MGLITKEITYDYQLNQSISEMTVTAAKTTYIKQREMGEESDIVEERNLSLYYPSSLLTIIVSQVSEIEPRIHLPSVALQLNNSVIRS